MGSEPKQDLRMMEEIDQERIGSGGGGRLEGGTRHSPNTTKSLSTRTRSTSSFLDTGGGITRRAGRPRVARQARQPASCATATP
jgi:hypothetical protein